MEWWVILIIIFGLLVAFLSSGFPVAFAFLAVNLLSAFIWMGGLGVLHLVPATVVANIGTFSFVAVPMFIFMGAILFHTGLARIIIDALGKWIGRLPGSLSLVAVGAGTLFGMVSGSAISGVAVLGSTLVPEMRERGYSKEMSLGPILGSGGLAMIIPPSIMAVIVAFLVQVPTGHVLIGGVIPGLILAGLYATYILVRGRLQPHLAPAFAPPRVTWGDRFKALALISPMSILIFLVLGVIFLGVATPSEAAATGAFGAFLLAIAYRRLSWQAIRKAISETVVITTMVFMILMSSTVFGQILAYTGSTSALAALASDLPVAPILVVFGMQIILIILGMFMDDLSILMITIPIYVPVIRALGLDPVWFSVVLLVNAELATISPPFGLLLVTMKGIVPDASTGDIYRAAIPFFLLGLIGLSIMVIFPPVVTWLPELMG